MEPSPSRQAAAEPTLINDAFSLFAKDHFAEMKKAGANSHSLKFHQCCFTFSTVKKRAQLGHPTHEAVTFRRLLEQHKVKSEEGFAALLRQLSAARTDNRAGRVPSYNQQHSTELGLGKRVVLSADAEPCGGVHQLTEQPQPKQPTVEALLEENQRLRKQLQLERIAAVQNENWYLSEVYTNEVLLDALKYHFPDMDAHDIRKSGVWAASYFQNSHPDRPSFGSIPRPGCLNQAPEEFLPQPSYEEQRQEFVEHLFNRRPPARDK